MVSFDPGLWRQRALDRYRKAKKTVRAAERLDQDEKNIAQLRVLVNWCAERGVDVAFAKPSGGFYYPDEKCIKINGRLSPCNQVLLLLHECGHHLIGDKEKRQRFSKGSSQTDPGVLRSFQHRCDVVDEEFEAWDRGFNLAQRLKLRVDKQQFDKARSEMLKTYFKWALRIDGYGKDDEDEEIVA